MITLKAWADVCAKFDHIKFRESDHSYHVAKDKKYTGATTFLKCVKEPFDEAKWLPIKARHNGIKPWEMKQQWKKKADDSIIKGKAVHYYLEMLWNNKIVDCPSKSARQFYMDYKDKVTLLRSEFLLCDDDIEVASQIDALFVDREGRVIIADYKTNGDFTMESKYKLLSPCQDLMACKYHEYSLQVSLYKHMLNKAGMTVDDMWIIWIHDTGYEVIKALDLTTHIHKICEQHIASRQGI